MALRMGERKSITTEAAWRYRRANKAQKGWILGELCALTGWSRGHAPECLKDSWATCAPPRPSRPRPRPDLQTGGRGAPGQGVGYPRGSAASARLRSRRRRCKPWSDRGSSPWHPRCEKNSLPISAATIDRLLASERRRLQVRGRPGTEPGPLLKRQIPSRTFADWDEAVSGFCEVDPLATMAPTPPGSSARPWT